MLSGQGPVMSTVGAPALGLTAYRIPRPSTLINAGSGRKLDSVLIGCSV